MIMKKIILILTTLTSMQVVAQDISEKVSKLKAPSSPASIVIGNQPATISKPKSWQALEASLYSNYVNQSGSFIVPNDYAIEFSPYWSSKNSSSLSIKDFAAPSISQTLLQNLSFSVSSTKNYLIKDSVKTDALGFGVRTMLWQGEKKEINVLLKNLLSIQEKVALQNFIDKLSFDISEQLAKDSVNDPKTTANSKKKFIKVFIEKLQTDKAFYSGEAPNFFSTTPYDKWVETIRKGLVKKLPVGKTDYSDEVSDLLDIYTQIDKDAIGLENMIKDRQGFKLEFATALALNFPTNKTDFSYVPKVSVWLTPSFQPFQNNYWEFLGVLRYTRLNSDFYKNYAIDKNYFDTTLDYGTRVVYKWDKFSFELELVGRHSKTILEKTKDANGVITEKSKTDNDFQYIMNFNYRISDVIILSYNFGSQFKPTFDSSNALISLATLNFGIGGPKKGDVK